MSFPRTVSFRHLRSPNRDSFTSFASFSSISGLAIGIAALVITMSILNGFEKTISQKLVNFDGHLQINHILGNTVPAFQDSLTHYFNSHRNQFRAIPYLRKPVIVRKREQMESVLIEGISENNIYIKLGSIMTMGNLKIGNNICILGEKLANELNVTLGDKVVFTRLDEVTSEFSGSHLVQMTIGGLFQSGISEYDKSIVYASLQDTENLLKLNGKVSGYSIHMNKQINLGSISEDIFNILGYPYYITTWKEKHSSLYIWMSVQKWPILIIFGMIALVGFINIMSALSMIIIEKIKEIGLLKALGCTHKQIRMIYLFDGTIIGTVGTIMGASIGLILIWLQAKFQLISIPEDVYFMDKIPVIISWEYLAIICFSCISVSVLASVFPTSFASKIRPAEAIRYE